MRMGRDNRSTLKREAAGRRSQSRLKAEQEYDDIMSELDVDVRYDGWLAPKVQLSGVIREKLT